MAAVFDWCFGHLRNLLPTPLENSNLFINDSVIIQFSDPYNKMGPTKVSSIETEKIKWGEITMKNSNAAKKKESPASFPPVVISIG